mgnify:CR=1 FL=1
MALRFVLSFAVALPLTYVVEAPIRTQRILRGRWFGAAWAATAATILAVTVAYT